MMLCAEKSGFKKIADALHRARPRFVVTHGTA